MESIEIFFDGFVDLVVEFLSAVAAMVWFGPAVEVRRRLR